MLKKRQPFEFVDDYRDHNDALALRQQRERRSQELSTQEINGQLKAWRESIARNIKRSKRAGR